MNEVSSITRDSLKSALLTFVQVMVNHAFSLDYIQTLKEKNGIFFCKCQKFTITRNVQIGTS